MRFTKKVFSLLYHDTVGDELFMNAKGKLPEINAFYYVSDTMAKDAIHNQEVLLGMHFKSGSYYLFYGNIQYLLKVHFDAPFEGNVFEFILIVGSKFFGSAKVSDGYIKYKANHNSFARHFTQEKMSENVEQGCYMAMVILCFIWHAPISQKVCAPKKKLDLIHCKYKSDVDYPITICDESWYTECAQRMPFWVRRHLRKQPCGHRSMDRKVIWIEPFVKGGYTKGAMIEGNARQRKERKKIKVFGVSGKPKQG